MSSLDQPLAWTSTHWPLMLLTAVLITLIVGLAAYIAHRTSGNVLAASIGALVCTGFSADTSWRFADHRLHMATSERLWLFAAGEVVLVVCAIMARANKLATATTEQAGTPGVPGVMVWCIAGVQVVPAFTESGLVGGLVRAVFGPVMAALLWHLAMGLEIRVTRPEALSTGLPAQIGHELRERLLSHLGLATRNRTAEEITRDRAHARAVRLASRRRLGPWGRARLAAAVARTRATTDGTRRHALLQDLAGRRTAEQLHTMDVISPWVLEPAPQPHPALERTQPEPGPDAVPDDFDDTTAAALAVAQPTAPQPDTAAPRIFTDGVEGEGAPAAAAAAALDPAALVLYMQPMLPPQPNVCAPDPAAAQPQPSQVIPATATPQPIAAAPASSRSQVAQLRSPDTDAHVLERAQALNIRVLTETGSQVSQRQLQRDLGIGQRRAQRIHAHLPTALPTPAAAAQPPAKEA
ncbi:hypothetical protein [Streptomyces sp. NBC_00582]|uniref:hypothetical protein n=1 Tax=Streptomyces sp. NBC_00582 TaxID=2975783 RepID=UPI002E80A70D|nr:hypothetical protein [Streptomyces sp. NBC_00582]WUB64450.1 hypothetical protein OG852_30680 [Streptomyces sp. NBC_00582]